MTLKQAVEDERKSIREGDKEKAKAIASWTKSKIKKFCKEVNDLGFNIAVLKDEKVKRFVITSDKLDVETITIHFWLEYESAISLLGSDIARHTPE